MADRSRRNPSPGGRGDPEQTLWVPPKPDAAPPSVNPGSERTTFYKPDASRSKEVEVVRETVPHPSPGAAPGDEGTVMLAGTLMIAGGSVGPAPAAQPQPPQPQPQPGVSRAPMPPTHSPAAGVAIAQTPPPVYPMPSRAPVPPQPSMGPQPPQGMGPQPQWRPPSGPTFAPQPLATLHAPPVRLQGSPDPRLVLLADPDSARGVSFRVLRDNLLAKRLPRVLAVTSAMKKEGKTTCAVNLALSLSEGARVLLVDGNFLEPALAGIFNIGDTVPPIPNAPWLGTFKVAELSRSLHIAAPPARRAAVPGRFEKAVFEQLLGTFRRFDYGFIVVDTPALSAAPTVPQLMAFADAALLAVRSGVTTARALRRASEQIPAGKGIGVALVDAKSS